MIKIRRQFITMLFSCAAILLLLPPAKCVAQTEGYSQYELKAAFLYSFLLFSDSDSGKSETTEDPIVIAVLGKTPFKKKAFDQVEKQPINGRKLIIRNYRADASIEDLKECRLVFIPSGNIEVDILPGKLKAMEKAGLLTVGEQPEFLKHGGMLNLTLLKGKIGFEVNTATAKRAGIRFRSKMLRLAARVIKNGKPKEQG